METVIQKNSDGKMLECINCSEWIEPDDAYVPLADGSILCPDCYHSAVHKWENFFGCPECYEKYYCSSLDPAPGSASETRSFEWSKKVIFENA